MPEIYIEPGQDPLRIYDQYRKKKWYRRASKGKFFQMGLMVGGGGALAVYLLFQVLPTLFQKLMTFSLF